MNVDFSKKDGGAGSVPAPVINIKTETVQSGEEGAPFGVASPGVPATTQRTNFVEPDSLPGFRDVMFPRINIVQNLGDLKDTFSPGEVVFGKQTVLFTPPSVNAQTGNVANPGTKPAIVHFLGVTQKRFGEIVVGGMGGIIVNTEEEVRTNGGTLDYKEWDLKKSAGMRRFGPMIDFLVAIQRPEHVKDDDTVFSFPAGDCKYALGLWSMFKTSYTEGYKKTLAFQRRAGVLKGEWFKNGQFEGGGYPAFAFALSTRENPYEGGKKKAWVPVLIPSHKVSPAFADFVNQIINPTA